MSQKKSSGVGVPRDYRLHPDEEALIRSFFARERREQFLRRLADPASRGQMRSKLNHFHGLDPRYARRIVPREQTPDRIHQLLTEKGAPQMCHVVGPSDLDGLDMDLKEALREIVPYSQGALISCISGKLGFFRGEEKNEAYILER